LAKTRFSFLYTPVIPFGRGIMRPLNVREKYNNPIQLPPTKNEVTVHHKQTNVMPSRSDTNIKTL
jgi:hypothetical protein